MPTRIEALTEARNDVADAGFLAATLKLDDDLEAAGMPSDDRRTCHPCQSWADHAHDVLTGARKPLPVTAGFYTFESAARELGVHVDQVHSIVAHWLLTESPAAWHGVNLRSTWMGPAGLELVRHALNLEQDQPTAPQVLAARNWLSDCEFEDLPPEELDDLSDSEIVAGVTEHYQGGWPAFIRALMGLA